jgi:hypothetical protein
MSKYYYNGNVIVTPFSIATNQPIFSADTVSLKHIRSQQSAQRWELQFNVLTNDNVAATLLGVIDEMGSTGLMVMPQLPEVDKATTAAGTISIPTQVEVENSSVGLDTSAATGTMPAGSFIKFDNHSKVYILKTDLDLSGATATAQVYPKVVQAIPIGVAMSFGQGCELTYYRDINGMNGIRFLDGVLADPGSINLIEAL